MTNTQRYFLILLKDYLHGLKSILVDEIDRLELLDLARAHKVEAIIHFQLSNAASGLYEASIAQVSRYVQISKIIQEIESLLLEKSYIWVKGAVVSDLYPQKQFRSMGDIDLLIRNDERDVINKLFIENGFRLVLKENETFVYYKYSILIEVHTSLIHPRNGNTKIVDYFKKAWDFQSGRRLTWDFHIVYLIAHLREHIMEGGVGIRQFLDIALLENSQELDWRWIEAELKKIDLLEFAEMCLSLIERWFGVKSHMKYIDITPIIYEEITEEILTGGVFGKPIKTNDDSKEIVNIMTNRKESLVFARIEYWLKQSFPPFGVMSKLPYCKYLNNKRYLLPVAWIHRFIVRIINHDYRERYVRRVSISNQQLEKRRSYYEKWRI